MRTERCIALSIVQHWTGKLDLVAETMQPDYRCRMHSLCGDYDRIPHQCCRVHSCDYKQEKERPRSTDVRRDRVKNFTSLVRSARRHPLSSACRVIFPSPLCCFHRSARNAFALDGSAEDCRLETDACLFLFFEESRAQPLYRARDVERTCAPSLYPSQHGSGNRNGLCRSKILQWVHESCICHVSGTASGCEGKSDAAREWAQHTTTATWHEKGIRDARS